MDTSPGDVDIEIEAALPKEMPEPQPESTASPEVPGGFKVEPPQFDSTLQGVAPPELLALRAAKAEGVAPAELLTQGAAKAEIPAPEDGETPAVAASAAEPVAADAAPAVEPVVKTSAEAPVASADAPAVAAPPAPDRPVLDEKTTPDPFEGLALPPDPIAPPAVAAAPSRERSLPPPPPSLRVLPAPPPPPRPLSKIAPVESSAIDEGWDSSGDESEGLTRRLELVVPMQLEDGARSELDVTSPLPPAAAAPLPYGSDTDLTRPLPDDPASASPIPGSPPFRGMPVAPLPPPPSFPAPSGVIVAVPPPSTGVMDHAPSIQISSNASRRSYPPPAPPSRSSAPPAPAPYSRTGKHETMPRIPRPAAVPAEFASRRSSMEPVAGSYPPPPGGVSRKLVIALAAGLFGIGALAFAFRPRTGALVITVSGADGQPLRGVAIRVDGEERCAASPCRIEDLPAGAHLVSAAAQGLPASAERAVSVQPGEPAAEHVTLVGTPRDAVSGLGVTAVGDGLHVFVDGKDLGAPPVSLRDVEPGTHQVRVAGADGLYEPYEETISLEGGEIRSLGPVRLHVLKGRLHLTAGEGAEGATVSVDGHRVSHLPAVLDLSPDQAHELQASRPGFAGVDQQIVFDGVAERSVVVSLDPADGATRPAVNRPLQTVPSRRALVSSSTRAAAPARATGSATLDINSSPRAAVVLNGRPLGSTPLSGIKVSPGPQTIVFVHPKLGRKVTSTNVAAGKHGSAFAKF